MKTTRADEENGARRRRSRIAVCIGLALSVAASPYGCRRIDDSLRGQSGSEAPAGTGGNPSTPDETVPCPCDAGGIFLRVTVLAADDPALRTVRVDAVIHGETDLGVGDRLNVEDDGQLPCSFGSAPVADGQQALAVFTPAEPAICDGGTCSSVAGSVRLTPWADELLFAQTPEGRVAVPASELDSLWSDDVDACMDRHGDVWRLLELSPAPDEP